MFVLLTPVPVRPRRRRGARRFLDYDNIFFSQRARLSARHPSIGFNPDTPRCLSTSTDGFQLHPYIIALYG